MAVRVRVYQPPKSAMQSGRGGTAHWVLEFDSNQARAAEPLMGWIGGADTMSQVRLRFGTREEALAFAERNGLEALVEMRVPHRPQPKAYADNFRHGRREMWTH